jgi:hypothetical protein
VLRSRFQRRAGRSGWDQFKGVKNLGGPGTGRSILMILPYDPLREAILLELSRAICARRARGASFGALELEYGVSEEVMQLILRRHDWSLEKRVARARLRRRPTARVG